MKGFNQVVLLGHVGKDAELKYTKSGVAVATFSLATSESWKDESGEKHELTQWHNCVAWRKLAEIVGEYVKKGDPLMITGKVTYEEYEKEGVKKYATKIVVNEINLLGSKKSGGQVAGDGTTTLEEFAAAAPRVRDSAQMPDESDLPF